MSSLTLHFKTGTFLVNSLSSFTLLMRWFLPFLNVFCFAFYLVGAVISRKPSSVIVEEGQNVSLICRATGQPTPTVTWRKAFSQLSKEKTTVVDGNLTILNIGRADGGAYACVAKNLLGKDSAVAKLIVLGKLIFTLIPPMKVVASYFSNVTLNCRAKGFVRNCLATSGPKSSSQSRSLSERNFASSKRFVK